MNPASSCILLFVKSPVPGRVKTRLAGRRLGEEAAAQLYRCFVNDLVRKMDAASLPLRLFYDPPDAEPFIRTWLGENRFYAPQNGKDLGERMKLAFHQVFDAGIKRAVLVGSDLPDLPADIAENALAALKESPAVIGPAKDGGYYLIGFRADSFTSLVFEGIAWSTGRVLETTLNRFDKAGLPIHRMPEWRDIDTWEDLMDLAAALEDRPEQAPETVAYLRKCATNQDFLLPCISVPGP